MAASADPPAWLARVLRTGWWHLVPLTAWGAAWFRWYARHGGHSWPLFVLAARLAVGQHPAATHLPGGLHLYANYPRFQFGPVTLLAAAIVRLIGPDGGLVAAQVLMALCGLAIVLVAERSARFCRSDADPGHIRWTVLGAGAVFAPVWMILAVSFGHLDDVLALLFAVLAVDAVSRGRAASAGVLLALSASAKPWALAFLILLLALPSRRLAAVGAAWAFGVLVVLWAPFVLADPGSVAAAKFGITNFAGSGLRAIGINTATTPRFDRETQVLGGFLLSGLAIWRGRWPAVILVCVAVRVALDPSIYPYYDASLVSGALVWDLLGSRRVSPGWTLACGALFWAWDAAGATTTFAGALRVGFAALAFLCTILGPAAIPAPPRSPPRRTPARANPPALTRPR